MSCGATYHIEFAPTEVEDVCDHCKAGLILREDDKPETVQKRLNVYHEQTQPLIQYYSEKDVLVKIDGTKDIEDVFETIVAVLGE